MIKMAKSLLLILTGCTFIVANAALAKTYNWNLNAANPNYDIEIPVIHSGYYTVNIVSNQASKNTTYIHPGFECYTINPGQKCIFQVYPSGTPMLIGVYLQNPSSSDSAHGKITVQHYSTLGIKG